MITGTILDPGGSPQRTKVLGSVLETRLYLRGNFEQFWKLQKFLGLNSLETDLIRTDGSQGILNKRDGIGSKFLGRFGRNLERGSDREIRRRVAGMVLELLSPEWERGRVYIAGEGILMSANSCQKKWWDASAEKRIFLEFDRTAERVSRTVHVITPHGLIGEVWTVRFA